MQYVEEIDPKRISFSNFLSDQLNDKNKNGPILNVILKVKRHFLRKSSRIQQYNFDTLKSWIGFSYLPLVSYYEVGQVSEFLHDISIS